MFKEVFKKYNEAFIYLFITVFSFIFFYYFNTISVAHDPVVFENDMAIFYTAGISMKRGLVLYKDLFDHKGPYVYFLYYIAALFGEKMHIGLYILFSIYFSILFIIIYKIIKLITDNKEISLLTTIFTYLYMFNDNISYGSLSSEHTTYLFVALSYYLFLKHRKSYYEDTSNLENEVFKKDKNKSDLINIFVVGILAGIVLFSKLNNTLMILPIAIIYLIEIIKNKNIKKLFLMFIVGLSGVFVGIIPGLIYIFKNNILKDFIEAYVTFNTKYLDNNFYLIGKTFGYTDSLTTIIFKYKFVIIMTIVSIIIMRKFFYKRKNELYLFYILSIIFTYINIFVMKRAYLYYAASLVFAYVPIAYLFTYVLFNKILSKIKINIIKYIIFVVLVFSISYAFIGNRTQNTYLEYSGVDELRKDYNEEKNKLGKNDIKFLSISSPNYYLVFDEVPAMKYFIRPMIDRTRYPDYYIKIENDIREFKYDMFMLSYTGQFAFSFDDKFYNFVEENYDLVSTLGYDKLYVKKK